MGAKEPNACKAELGALLRIQAEALVRGLRSRTVWPVVER